MKPNEGAWKQAATQGGTWLFNENSDAFLSPSLSLARPPADGGDFSI